LRGSPPFTLGTEAFSWRVLTLQTGSYTIVVTKGSSDYSDDEFEWDLQKDKENLSKHGVSFELARHVFNDPAHYTGQGYVENGELRDDTLGRVSEHLVLRVTHTDRTQGELSRIRILSARKADAKERKTYEQRAFQ
jgi:uncharacterized protein